MIIFGLRPAPAEILPQALTNAVDADGNGDAGAAFFRRDVTAAAAFGVTKVQEPPLGLGQAGKAGVQGGQTFRRNAGRAAAHTKLVLHIVTLTSGGPKEASSTVALMNVGQGFTSRKKRWGFTVLLARDRFLPPPTLTGRVLLTQFTMSVLS